MITASYDTLFKQAPMTAHSYLINAINDLDEQFGKGYAQAHPELVAAYMNVCNHEFGNSALIIAIQEATTEIAAALEARHS